MKVKAIVRPAEEGGYYAEIPAFPGCVTEGDSWEEVVANLEDALRGWLAVANEAALTAKPADVMEITISKRVQ